jgi:hypothetical protein
MLGMNNISANPLLGPMSWATLVMTMNAFVNLCFENNAFIINNGLSKFKKMDWFVD